MGPRRTPDLPAEREGTMIPLTIDRAALARTVDATISSATSIVLQLATTLIEVTALDQGVYLRYQAGVDATNFDEYIHADTTRHFVVPNGVTTISVIERVATAGVIVIEK